MEPCDSNTEYWKIFSQDSVFIVLPSYQPVRCGRGGQEIDSQHDTYRQSQLGSQLPARPSRKETGFTIITIILWLGKTDKSRFLYLLAIHKIQTLSADTKYTVYDHTAYENLQKFKIMEEK
jgi:hypothetical protein